MHGNSLSAVEAWERGRLARRFSISGAFAPKVRPSELPKLPNEDGTKLLDWLKFLKATTQEELAMLSDKNPQIKKVAGKLMALSDDERTRMLAESREKLRRDFVATREGGRAEGSKEGLEKGLGKGREEGRTEERLAMARKLLNRGRPIEEIMEDTGLSKKEIQSLLH
ncbi:MAG: Rpn family recombination-promoting nuclease/putative transposase [Azoarcus sp.]|jgi:predicted transposase/invertase (TIGR01784 family)|nr:Rpn family recombination-promoting nuclease/putative transposase [Azoarcus sp.]